MTADSLRDLRRALGLTQLELARALGRGRRQIQKYEADLAPIPEVVVLACATLRRLKELG